MSIQNVQELNNQFAILDHVRFEEIEHGLVRVLISTPNATASLLTQGAHLLDWTPAGQKPGLYLSPAADMLPGKAVRGGVPVIFPWFGAYSGEKKPGLEYILHGFARVSVWTIDRTHFSPDGDVELTLSLTPNEESVKFGYDNFRCQLDFQIGKTLSMTLAVTNLSNEPFTFEEGFHTYFAVGHPSETTVEGLEGTTYLDKREDFKAKQLTERLLHFKRDVDQVHVDTANDLVIHDNDWKRDIIVEKSGSSATVCWNPWTVLTPNFKDLAPDSWEHFVCVEAVNCMQDKVTVAPGATHTLNCTISYKPQA